MASSPARSQNSMNWRFFTTAIASRVNWPAATRSTVVLERVEVLEERAVALGEGIEAAGVEAQLAQAVRDHAVVLGLVAGLPGEGHLDVDVVGLHQPARGDLGGLDLVLERHLQEVRHREAALDLGLERGLGREPPSSAWFARVERRDEFLGRHAATPSRRIRGSSWVRVSLVTTRSQRSWSGWVWRARTCVV